MATRDTAIQRTSRKISDIGSGVNGATNVILSDTEIGEEVDAAVIQYGSDAPRESVVNIAGDGSQYYNVTSLTGFVDGFTVVQQIEYPFTAVSATKDAPTWLVAGEDWDWYRTATVTYLRFRNHTPAATETFNVWYTRPHQLDNSTDTIPTVHFDAVCDLAAAYCCRRLAAKFAKSLDASINADAVNFRDGQMRMKQTADAFEKQYKDKVSIPQEGPTPAGVVHDWDVAPSWYGGSMFHRSRWR